MTTPIETILGHDFTRPELLREAMTHRSAVHGRGRPRGKGSNERMEFVGDRVLGLLIAEWLAERFPREQEGDLGRRLALLVSQPVLAEVAETIGLGEALSVAPGEAKAGVRRRATVLADALEAALGALYLDGGLERAREFVRRAWDGAMNRAGGAAARMPRRRCRNGCRRAGSACRTMSSPRASGRRMRRSSS